MKWTRRKFGAEFKARVAIEALKETVSTKLCKPGQYPQNCVNWIFYILVLSPKIAIN